ncbi:MAG: cytochrome C [Nevskiaceae bacterium]|nr:MAG: cytochrome C [Nevskiaceae bacterium]
MKSHLIVSAFLIAAATTVAICPAIAEDASPQTIVDKDGNMRMPDNYRTDFQFLGAWAIAAESGGGSKEMHIVYASPGTIDQYRATGQFPDGAVLVKEVYETSTESMATGTVSRASTLKGWFLMVKDRKGKFPNNKLWGDGWGWSWFDAADPTKTTSTDYVTDCKSCHVPARSTDWIYVQGYPPLAK